MSQKRILLIAPTGQVGWELLRCAQPLGTVIPVSRVTNAYGHVDLSNADSVRRIIQQIKPDIILNAAAYTAVDKAEEETELAFQVNGTAPAIMAEEAKKLNALLVHYSTDYVFDGESASPYTEEDKVNPMGAYGKTKLAGEEGIEAIGGEYLILRTAWVYGIRGKNFLLTMQRLANERDELRIVSDQIGAPTWSYMISQATVQVLSQLYSPQMSKDRAQYSGIYHLTSGGQTSWYEFAKAIIAREEKQPNVIPIPTAEYPTPAKRPAYSVLSNQKLQQTFGITVPEWDKTLELCLDAQQER
ncbi:dTDP-4-dehydrorhamnose reductase [Candidatus Albibeggiatoa sp. nov. NOAA]|uniref:dTDP-4-dehydrorhamnose reductase n=1 Tax=Candidatus Albibeggiatoa sp. nov. NOAA TaxID=3162724 RepID=UPI0032F9D4B3|nr:dTDP-4-dehydrorhamnose reductase [Thiotrichaceae bacterium]